MNMTTNYQHNPLYSRSGFNSLNQFHLEASRIDIKDSSLKSMINRLIKNNQDLTDKLHQQKQRNFELMQLKRRLQQDIKRLQFEIDRIGNYENLNHREIEIKRNQMIMDNNKLQNQLDEYFEENKKIRADLRKWMNQCEQVSKQKEDLVNQNVILLNQIADLKEKLADTENQIYEYQREIKALSSRNYERMNQNSIIHQIGTVRSTKQRGNLENQPRSRQEVSIHTYQSPKARMGAGQNFFRKGQLSTNPSQNKISLSSPDLLKSQRNVYDKFEKIQQNFYQENAQPSPRSFSNKLIQQNLQFFSPYKEGFDLNSNPSFASINYTKAQKQSPSVMTYANRESPNMEILKFNAFERGNRVSEHFDGNNGAFLETFQKRQLKQEVSKIRNDLVEDLVNQYYTSAINRAEQQKSNSLKIFMDLLGNKLDTVQQMVKNYLEARSMLAQSCPTLRLKWQPINPLSNNSAHSQNEGTQSQLINHNTFNLSNIYQSIKQNTRKQKTIAGQYLALFRLLTLLNKIEKEVDPLLIDCIKHSALKQVYRIRKCRDGESWVGQD